MSSCHSGVLLKSILVRTCVNYDQNCCNNNSINQIKPIRRNDVAFPAIYATAIIAFGLLLYKHVAR